MCGAPRAVGGEARGRAGQLHGAAGHVGGHRGRHVGQQARCPTATREGSGEGARLRGIDDRVEGVISDSEKVKPENGGRSAIIHYVNPKTLEGSKNGKEVKNGMA